MFARQLGSLLMVSNQQEAVSPKVPKIPHRDEIVRVLKERMPEDDVALVHGDFKWDNLLIHPTEPRVVAVLDWELSTIGHPMSDLSNLCGAIYFSPYAPDTASGGGVIGMPDLENSGIPTQEELVEMYCQMSQRKVSKADWHFYLSFYFWRGAIIAQGIGARLFAGQASSIKGAEYFLNSMPILAEAAKHEMDELVRLQGEARKMPTILGKHIKLEDDYTHKSKTEANNYNESVYCNFHSSNGRAGGFVRIGNRPNEGFAEVTLCLFAFDTKATLFHFSRPKILSNNGWDCDLSDTGRISFRVKRPMDHISIQLNGRVHQLLKPWLLRDPETLFKKHRKEVVAVQASVQLDFIGCGPVFGHAAPPKSTKETVADGNDFARSHYEQHGSVQGHAIVKTSRGKEGSDESRIVIDGCGLRDHSWVRVSVFI